MVIGFGATARGAVTALNAHGVHNVAVLTSRAVAAVGSPIHSVVIRQFEHDPDGVDPSHVITERGREPLAAYLAQADIVVNCTLQDPNDPQIYLQTEDLDAFRPGSVIVDVSCDLGMGFSWARPTPFEDPAFIVGDNILYYAVDHSPSYLWNSATWENSNALIPFLRPVLEGAGRVGRRRDPEPGDRDQGRPDHQPGDPGLPGTRGGAASSDRLSTGPTRGFRIRHRLLSVGPVGA